MALGQVGLILIIDRKYKIITNITILPCKKLLQQLWKGRPIVNLLQIPPPISYKI